MIELIDAQRCTGCNICVLACPTNVFAPLEGQAPRIARQDDCQTCYMCEVYCPEDALFVAPYADRPATDAEIARQAGQWLGSYREAVGWGKGRQSTASADQSYQLLGKA
ncbi:4Fe-4S ferredoxin [Pseudomonas sp. Ost2]|uniref:4Fe-4S dicluster domain-containing protein n=1 Tax=Pseudomonas TaxID=286 RepID=UPI0015BB5E90|nr:MULTISPECIES: ferredoxin family protein [Pseudomonas]NWE73776.1 ferredoxin family protein [Pseudomonas gingeri]BBP76210.1 4Fe-4S ferredoxin [Pseudomonas sp. Ost2]